MTLSPTAPKIWGKSFWTTLHIIALGYPDDPEPSIMKQYKWFYENFGDLLPCKRCSKNYKQHLVDLPLDKFMSTRDALFAWTVKLHNIVNNHSGKAEWTVDYAKEFYFSGSYNECSSLMETRQIRNDIWKLVLIFMMLINIVIAIYIIINLR